MLPLIAVPVIHSSGAWIASTAAGGYLTSTLSATWAGAFIAGNSSLLASAGLASMTAVGGFFAGTSSTLATTLRPCASDLSRTYTGRLGGSWWRYGGPSGYGRCVVLEKCACKRRY